jgi:hypothetical protein
LRNEKKVENFEKSLGWFIGFENFVIQEAVMGKYPEVVGRWRLKTAELAVL